MAGAGRRRARRSRARAAAALVVAGLALAAACGGAEAGRRRRGRGPKVDGVVAARACSWAPDPGGGGGALELTGVEVSQVFAVSPRRGAANATLEALAQAFTAPRKPRNVALTAWPSGGGPRYIVGELAGAEAGPAELRLRLRVSAAQARASAPEILPTPAFQAASCSLFLDAAYPDCVKATALVSTPATPDTRVSNCGRACPIFGRRGRGREGVILIILNVLG